MISENLTRYVNPLQGTNSHNDFSQGNTLPLVSRPFGLTAWFPQTNETRWPFLPQQRQLQAVRATHQPCPWHGDYGALAVLPQVGPPRLQAKVRASIFRPEETTLLPHYFETYLRRYNVHLRMAPTGRCAIFQFDFPAADQARVILEPFPGASSVQIDRDRNQVTGWTRSQGKKGSPPPNLACYFAAWFDKPITRFAPFQAEFIENVGDRQAIFDGEDQKEGERVGAFAEFSGLQAQTVEMRIATSFISVEQAQRNLRQEVEKRTLEEVKSEGENVWNETLSRITLEGGTEEQRRTFYSCLYRTQLFPREWYEHAEDGRPLHFSPYDGQIHEGVLYADSGFWDTYRTNYPLYALLQPKRLAEILEGWVQASREGGWIPQWPCPGYSGSMIGTHGDAAFADAVVKGIAGFDVQTALAGMRRHAYQPGHPKGIYGRLGIERYMELGYVPADEFVEATSRTLDYAYDDFCIAQVEEALGHTEEAAALRERAFNYRNVYDPQVGFMRGRNADGSWVEPFSELAWGGPYVEGGPWQSTWAVAHDPAGLIALMGGPEAFAAKLDRMLAMEPVFELGTFQHEIHEITEMAAVNFGQYGHSNQPVHHVLSLFAAVGQPWKMEHWTRRVLNELYSPDSFAGDEDNGEMASWYILNALGLFPLCPGTSQYIVGAPLFPKATFRLENGKTLTIEAKNNSAENCYVQEVALNGQPYSKLWISYDTLMNGGTLQFVMGSQPATERRWDADALPYSLSTALAQRG